MASAADLKLQTTVQHIALRVLAVLLVLAGLAWQTSRVLVALDGSIAYALDDPYIHLSLAENLLNGHYGINLDEVASPSSSILYPFLIAGGLYLGLGDASPLAVNVLPMLAAAWIVGGLVARLRPSFEPALVFALGCVLLAMSALALPFTGMEHSAHVWASLLIVAGLIRLVETGRASLWLVLGIVLAPLLRFEGLALSGCAILALMVWGRFGAAILSPVVIAAAFGSYVYAMTQLGLPPLPSSVMVKSSVSSAAANADVASVIASILYAMYSATWEASGIVLLVGMGLIVLSFGQTSPEKPGRGTVGLVVLAAAFAHLVAGDFGWFARYEVYITATVFGALLWLYSPLVYRGSRVVGWGVAAVFLGFGMQFLDPLLRTPAAAQNVYQQQGQMHRFATEFFPEPVAVNDLGWVSYQNDQYVLDLWGLGSEEARQIAATGHTVDNISGLVSRHDVQFAMIYESWFEDAIPPEWCRIAQLQTSRVSSDQGTVEFFLINRSREAEMRAALDAFQAEIVAETQLETYSCAGG